MKVDFEHEHYVKTEPDVCTIYANNFDLGAYLVDESNIFNQIDFSYTLSSVSMIVRSHLQKIPYKKNSAEWLNIYVSCLLTLLDSMTLSNFDLKRSHNITRNKETILDRMYTDLRYREPILYHLSPTMSGYIRVLVNELRHVISSQLSFELHSSISVEDTAKNLILSSLEKDE